MTALLAHAELAGRQFQPPTQQILGKFGLNCLPAPPDFPVEHLDEFEHVISDVDGVARAYGSEAVDDVKSWYNRLTGCLSFVSLNPDLLGETTYLGAPLYVAKPRLHGLPLPVAGKLQPLRQAMRDSGVSPDKTIALFDGLTDGLAARLAGIGYLAIVPTKGGHPVQEAVHKHVYGRTMHFIGSVLAT